MRGFGKLLCMFLILLAGGSPAVTAPVTATVYNGLLYAEMQPIEQVLQRNHISYKTLWHDAQKSDTACPRFILGHSMGGNAALRQAAKCQAAGRPPALVVTIDPGRAPLSYQCPKGIRCVNYYNPAHPIGGQWVAGAENHIVTGYDHLYMPLAVASKVAALVRP